jgi:hypothetical protein
VRNVVNVRDNVSPDAKHLDLPNHRAHPAEDVRGVAQLERVGHGAHGISWTNETDEATK